MNGMEAGDGKYDSDSEIFDIYFAMVKKVVVHTKVNDYGFRRSECDRKREDVQTEQHSNIKKLGDSW